jgi:hypothetical protein
MRKQRQGPRERTSLIRIHLKDSAWNDDANLKTFVRGNETTKGIRVATTTDQRAMQRNGNTMERRCRRKELKNANIRLILAARDFQFDRSTMCEGNTKKTQSNADLPSFLQSE